MAHKVINVTRGLVLPNTNDMPAVQQRYAFMGLPGSGKSNAAAVMIEAFLEAGEQVIILDPAAIWWSLRLKADSKKSAHKIAVFGGDHADVPLTPHSGKLVAEALARTNESAVIDLSDFRIGEQRQFVTDFAEAFFYEKKKNPGPVNVVLEEAHEFIPQHVTGGEARMFGALKRAAKIGRNFGIGWTYIDHRPQEMHKAVLNLVSRLFVFKLSGKHERKSITAWLVETEAGGHAKLDADLTKLPQGTAQVWAPDLGIDKQIKFPLKSTYDAGKGARRSAKAVQLKPLNLSALEKSMAAVVEQAKENDPKHLKRRIIELEREITKKPKTAAASTPQKIKEVHVERVHPSQLLNAQKKATKIRETIQRAAEDLDDLVSLSETIYESGKGARVGKATSVPPTPPQPLPHRAVALGRRTTATPTNGTTTIGKGERTVLIAIAQYTDGATREQISLLTAYKSSSRNLYIQRLKAAGYVHQGMTDTATKLHATDEGVAALGDDYEPLPTGQALQQHWLEKLPAGEKKILEVVLSYWPEGVSREQIGDETEYKSSSRNLYIQRLKARQLINPTGDGLAANETLFD